MPVVLVITDFEDLVAAIAEVVVAAGYTGFVALPSVASDLQRCAKFDLILAYGDLAAPLVDRPADRARTLRLIRERLARLDEVMQAERITAWG